MKIEIWSDFACPFCYIGETAMLNALENLNIKEKTELVYKCFQLDQNAKRQPDKDINQIISEKYNISYEQAKTSNQQVIDMAYGIGLKYDFDNLKPNNTGKAHELFKFAEAKGKAMMMAQRLFKAYFEDGLDIGDLNVLTALAEEVGLNKNEAEKALLTNEFYEAVVTDQAMAFRMRIQSVPCFVIDGQYAIQGAQATGYFEKAFNEILGTQEED